MLDRRRVIVSSSLYDDDDDYEDEDDPDDEDKVSKSERALNLSEEELQYIVDLLKDGNLEEDDAELILTVMRRHTEDVETHLPAIMRQFPHLAKNVYRFCVDVANKELVGEIVFEIAKEGIAVQEYQLFWFGIMLEEYLLTTKRASDLIGTLFNHSNASDISRAKILEIADERYGLPELRGKYLTTGQSDWLSWSSAVGSRKMKIAARNYRLTYFKNSSPMNRLIGDIIGEI